MYRVVVCPRAGQQGVREPLGGARNKWMRLVNSGCTRRRRRPDEQHTTVLNYTNKFIK